MFKRGFSLWEILIVIAIMAILGAITLSPFVHFREEQQLQLAAEETLSTLAKARTQTLAGYNDNAYGVHFQSDRLVLFVGPTYQSGNADNETILFNPLVRAEVINLSGGTSEVFFRRLSGEASATGTVTIALVASSTRAKVITVAATGIARAD